MKKMAFTLLFALVLPAAAAAAAATELYQQSFGLESAGSYSEALARMDQLAAAGVKHAQASISLAEAGDLSTL